MISLNFSANIVESLQTNNKKTEKITFLLKKKRIPLIFRLKTGYFS